MAYKVIFTKSAKRQLDKLDRSVQQHVGKLIDRIERLTDPRSIGEALHGDLKGLWKYRAGDWRLQCAIVDKLLIVELVEIAHRSEAY